MIQIKNVSFSYKEQEETLHQINLNIKEGECVLLCGESGCGKTTVTKLINGLIPYFTEEAILRGSVQVDDLPAAETELYELARHIGSVFQNPKSQFFNLDTDSELAFASVYAMKPAIYVLDEPTANLDAKATGKLRQQILLLKEQGHTIVIAEHRLYFLADLIDRAVYFRRGQIAKVYSGQEFRALSEAERCRMGLRELVQTKISLPEVRKTDSGKGLLVEQVSCGYRKEPEILRNLSFAAVPGEVLAITGANGTGKTTLTR